MFIQPARKHIVICTIAAALLLQTAPLQAHPHMFITAQVEFVWQDDRLAGAYQTWVFDRFFSADIIQGFDSDNNGHFNAAETQAVYNEAFINTKQYYYFTFIRQEKTRTSPQAVSDFSVRQNDGIVSYRFYVDLHPFRSRGLYFAVYDYTFFCDFRYNEQQPVTFSGCSGSIQPHYTITENQKNPVYYDPMDTEGMSTVYTSWKPGLQIYYPKEIYLTY